MVKIDQIDRRILKILQHNGRISNLELSELVSLSASACHRRLKRLSDEKIIKSFCALLDPKEVSLRSTKTMMTLKGFTVIIFQNCQGLQTCSLILHFVRSLRQPHYQYEDISHISLARFFY